MYTLFKFRFFLNYRIKVFTFVLKIYRTKECNAKWDTITNNGDYYLQPICIASTLNRVCRKRSNNFLSAEFCRNV